MNDYVREISKSKKWLSVELKTMGLKAYSGYANFIHIKFPAAYNIKAINDGLKRKGYLVRIAGEGLPAVLDGCMRITLGPLRQMKKFAAQLNNEMGKIQ